MGGRLYYLAEEAIDVSYQLEREARDRVARYHHEAALRRLSKSPEGEREWPPTRAPVLRSRLARALRRLADRMEPLGMGETAGCSGTLHGRNG